MDRELLFFLVILLYCMNYISRKVDRRTLSNQIRGLETAVQDLRERVDGMQRRPAPENALAGDARRTAKPEAATRESVAMAAVAEKTASEYATTATEDLEDLISATVYGQKLPAPEKLAGARTPAGEEMGERAGREAAPLSETASLPQDAAGAKSFAAKNPTDEEDEFARLASPAAWERWTSPPFRAEKPMEAEDYLVRYPDPPPAPAPAKTAACLHALAGFIRGGNLWVAGGVIMLLLGFAFLAQLGIFSVELRITAAAVTGMAMVGLGLRLRLRGPTYALALQGGGIGVLYLSAFASAKLTTLLPPAAALAVMTALIIPAVALAVLQNAQILALFGFVGGFAAPILLSDNSGNHIALFSCYTLLNLGILAICRYRLWRWLNFAGAFCTFVVMGYWGLNAYDVAKFATTEPFLIGFALIYIGITLNSVRREDFSFSDPLDAILACSIPFLAALFQWRIVMDLPHGLSLSAIAFGAFFIALAVAVWKLRGERARRLAILYLANGVVFANLAAPLELSGAVTSTVWAVEGAMLFFLACRIRSTRIKAVALLLQAVGIIAFFQDVISHTGHTLLSTSLISLAALSSACLHKLDADDPRRESPEAFNAWLGGNARLENILAVLGLLWWYGGVALEVARFAERPLAMFFLAASLSSAGLFFAEKAAGLRVFFRAAVGVPLAAAACCLLVAAGGDFLERSTVAWRDAVSLDVWRTVEVEARLFLRHNFLTGWSALAWAAFAATQIGMLRLGVARVKASRHAWWAGLVALELLLMLTSSGRGAALDLGLSRAWGHLASIFPALAYTAALTWAITRRTEGRAALLSRDHARVLGGAVPAILFAPLGVWLFFSFFSLGRPAPLPFYVPVLNPLELKQVLCIATFALWQRAVSQIDGVRFVLPLPRLLLIVDALLFLWLHSMLFRAIAHFTGAPMGRAWEHESFQVLLTALWGVWGMAHLILGHRRRVRLIWAIGASLMLADTAKLFLMDLADKDTLFRVISFFVMGGIFLLIGWIAPLPPSARVQSDAGPPEPGADEADPNAKESTHAPER